MSPLLNHRLIGQNGHKRLLLAQHARIHGPIEQPHTAPTAPLVLLPLLVTILILPRRTLHAILPLVHFPGAVSPRFPTSLGLKHTGKGRGQRSGVDQLQQGEVVGTGERARALPVEQQLPGEAALAAVVGEQGSVGLEDVQGMQQRVHRVVVEQVFCAQDDAEGGPVHEAGERQLSESVGMHHRIRYSVDFTVDSSYYEQYTNRNTEQ